MKKRISTNTTLKFARGGRRDTNLELYRIIGMILIVAHHYVVNSGIFEVIYRNPLSVKSIFYLIFGAWGKTGINCFLMITGYYMCEIDISVKKWIRLLSEVMFYRMAAGSIFWITGYESFTIKKFVKLLIPVRVIENNFTGCFLVFYLFLPFLKILVQNMNEKQHRNLLILCSFTYIFFGTIPSFHVSMNYVSWFCVVFIIAAYIRKYPKKLWNDTVFWGRMSFVAVVLSVASVIVCAWVGEKTGRGMAYEFVSDSNTFLAVLTGVSTFLFFKNMKIPYSPIVNHIAATTFGILCIHAGSDTMRQWLWKDTLRNAGMYDSEYWMLYPIVCVAGVFVVCSVIDMVRARWVERYWMAFIDKGKFAK